MSVSTAKRVCLACVGFACVSGLPFPFMTGNWYVTMEGRTTSQCLIGNTGERKVWQFFYCLSSLTVSVIFAVIVTCLQVIIWKTILALKALKLREGQSFRHIKNQDATSKDERDARRAAENDNVKITLTFCIITVLLIVSYFPHTMFNTYVAYKNYQLIGPLLYGSGCSNILLQLIAFLIPLSISLVITGLEICLKKCFAEN